MKSTRSPRRLAASGLAALVVASGAVALGAATAPADAGNRIPRLPKTNPVNDTPQIVDDQKVPNSGVRELRQVGKRMYAGGAFHKVTNAKGTKTFTRNNIVSFKAGTGRVLPVRGLSANGPVYAFQTTGHGRYLYIGGDFTTFGGQAANHLVKFDLKTHQVDTAFRFPLKTNRVSDLAIVKGRLFVAGNFPGGIVSVDKNTGARTTYLDKIAVAGSIGAYRTRVFHFALNPRHSRMVIIGSFTTVGGQPRQQVAMVKLHRNGASVSPWTASGWDKPCARNEAWYTRDVDWAPNGHYFVVVTTGGPHKATYCDSASRWAPTDAANQHPTWVQKTGGDTIYSVAVTNRAVFVGGHFRWLNNPHGHNNPGPGAVSIRGLGALNLKTGRAIKKWDPTKSLEGGHGAFDLYFTSRGLWVAHFEREIGHELHQGVGLLPF